VREPEAFVRCSDLFPRPDESLGRTAAVLQGCGPDLDRKSRRLKDEIVIPVMRRNAD
jgi:hypothetical protein